MRFKGLTAFCALMCFASIQSHAAMSYDVSVDASGLSYKGTPILSVVVNGKPAGTAPITVDKTGHQIVDFKVDADIVNTVAIGYINDYADKGGDRNLYIKGVTLNGYPLDLAKATFADRNGASITNSMQLGKSHSGNFNISETATWTADALPGATLVFKTRWDQDTLRGGWNWSQTEAPDRIQYDPNTLTPHGLPGAHVRVLPGDNPIHSSGERSEVLQSVTNMLPGKPKIMYETGTNDVVYLGTSYRYPANWAATAFNSDWSVQLQLHGWDQLNSVLNYPYGISPAFALGLAKDNAAAPETYTVSTTAGLFTSNWYNLQMNRSYYKLSNSTYVPDKWTDFIFRFKYNATPDGSITVWRRDEGQAFFTRVLDASGIPTLQQAQGQPVMPHYWKQGHYRGVSGRTDELWIGPTAIAGSFADAEMGAFNTHNGEDPKTVDNKIVNGVCGSANGQTWAGTKNGQAWAAPQGSLCSAGTASVASMTWPLTYGLWTCAGHNGGKSAVCQSK